MKYFLLIIFPSIVSTIIYYILHIKTKTNIKYLYLDNIYIIAFSSLSGLILLHTSQISFIIIVLILQPALVFLLCFGLTMIRFWKSPSNLINSNEYDIVSPADGNIIYITRVISNQTPVSTKKGTNIILEELTKTNLIEGPCWIIGINMTLFDVHKNCSPIDGKIVLNEHHKGDFLSLKMDKALINNERNTIVIKNNNLTIGIVQIASRLVRRIDTYVQEKDSVKKGDLIGMIRFGSQVDVILPEKCLIKVKIKDQIYARKTIIASIVP